jgi:HAD superfamily hydrolase (TIGR01549 family)
MYQRVIRKETGLEVSRKRMDEVWNKIVIDTEEAAAREISRNGTLAWEGFNGRLLKLLGYKYKDLNDAGKKLLYEVWSNPRNFRLYSDVIPTLDLLRIRGIRCACVSNEDKGLIKFFEYFQIENYFEKIFTSEEIGFEKPNPRIFEIALKEMRCKPKEVLHVGDSVLSDYYGAELSGICPVLIDRTGKIKKNIRIVNKLTDITSYLED